MKIQFIDLEPNLQICIIDNIFEEHVKNDILSEITYLDRYAFFDNDYNKSGSAFDERGQYLIKNKFTLALDSYFIERDRCSYFKYYKHGVDVIRNNLNTISKFWQILLTTDFDSTLLAGYNRAGYYKPHRDSSAITQLYWINNEPKKFTGGDLVLSDFDYTVEYKSNRMILFPGFLKHEVTTIESTEEILNSIDSRFSFSTFYLFK
jgi:Rps23 Pro-64 3,4-dihydroxylase Tpa1-like proline 4-hydroxylase